MISENDWNSIRVSLRKMNEVVLWRELGDTKVTLRTAIANKAWTVAMLVGVTYERGGLVWFQWFESLEAARRELERYI